MNINTPDGKHASLLLIQLNAAQMHKSFTLARTASSSIKPFVETRQASSKLTPVSVSSRANRAWFLTSGFLTTGFSVALWNLKLCHRSLCLPLTWILLRERGIHALPRSYAPDKADASDNSHPQLLPLSLRSGSQQVPASTRERLGVSSSIPAHMKLPLKAEEEPSCCSPWNQLCRPGWDSMTPPETCEQQFQCKSTGTHLCCIT